MELAWSADVFRDTLQLIAEGVTDLVGFEVAAVSVVGDDGLLEVIAVAGSDDCRNQLLGHRTTIADIQAEIANAEDWGTLKFVPAERMGLETEDLGWIPDIAVSDDPEDWHPLDLLMAPFYDSTGALRGLMSMDVPTDGKRPRPEKRAELAKYAEKAGRAILSAHDHSRLAERVRLAETAREVVRRATTEESIEDVFDYIEVALLRGFNAQYMWIRIFEDEEVEATTLASAGLGVTLSPRLAEVAREAAVTLWQREEVWVLDVGSRPPGVSRVAHEEYLQFLEDRGIESILFAPLGAGSRCMGNLVLAREKGQEQWSETEKRAARDIARDLGQTLLAARNLARQRRLNEELRALDIYKSRLIATVSHELRSPLTAVAGYLEILGEEPDLSPAARGSLASMARGVDRMGGLVEDLLAFSRAADPTVEVSSEPVDLRPVVDDVIDLLRPLLEQRHLDLRYTRPDHPVVAAADPEDMARVFGNLVGNACKYSDEGGRVELELRSDDDAVVFRCHDDGIGISEEDQASLFVEFFRSTNPDALAVPGTGLGLAIVKRIVDRHEGEITVDSILGKGSTFSVRLPTQRLG